MANGFTTSELESNNIGIGIGIGNDAIDKESHQVSSSTAVIIIGRPYCATASYLSSGRSEKDADARNKELRNSFVRNFRSRNLAGNGYS